jgi:hypothetical protein
LVVAAEVAITEHAPLMAAFHERPVCVTTQFSPAEAEPRLYVIEPSPVVLARADQTKGLAADAKYEVCGLHAIVGVALLTVTVTVDVDVEAA